MTTKINAKNERIKREFFIYQREVEGKASSTVDAMRKAIIRFETYTDFKDFTTFNKEQATGFKRHIVKQKAVRSNEPLSLSTVHATLIALKDFFRWLSQKPGYKSKIDPLEIGYFNLSEKETRIAKAPTIRDFPTMEQARKALFGMEVKSEVDHRNQALIAFILMTGMRVDAAASIRLKHVDIDRKRVIQKPDQVRTKFSKQIVTFFFPVGDDIEKIFFDWVAYLRQEKLYGENSPVFPRTSVKQDQDKNFTIAGLEAEPWADAAPIRRIFKDAFNHVGLPYFNPHLIRKTLVQFGQRVCKTPEEFKAWSQNLGHEDVDTTFRSYGQVSLARQGEIILNVAVASETTKEDTIRKIQELAKLLN